MENQNIPQDTIQKEEPSLVQSTQFPINQTHNQGVSENNKAIVTVILLVFVYPVGLLLMWFWTKWPRWAKIIISLPLFLAILGILAVALLATINPVKQLNQAKCAQQCVNSENKNICIDTCIKNINNALPTTQSYYGNTTEALGQQAKHDMGELQSALELFRADNQSYPQNLSLLVPKYIQGVKTNPFNNKQYEYSLTGQNKYTLSTQLPDGTTYTVASP